MFVLPTFENAKLKRVPWATIIIIVCCSWVFFVLQHNENNQFKDLIMKYGQNGYFDYEVQIFNHFQESQPEEDRIYLKDSEHVGDLPEQREGDAYVEWMNYHISVWNYINGDLKYQQALKNNTLKLPVTIDPNQWLELRDSYLYELNKIVSIKYAFKTAWPTLLTAFTSTFIHGDLYHLLGNMVFLFIVGTILEAAIGSWLFLVTYLVCGIGCSYLTIPFQGPSTIGSIGASGAISAVMGTYSVLLGRTMVPAFVSFGFYFTNMRVPALSLILFWMGKEILYEILYPDSRVNYMAHLSGFIIGGGFGIVFKFFKGNEAKKLFEVKEETTEKNIDSLIARSVECLRNLEPEEARKCLNSALWIRKDDLTALQQLFIVELQIGEDQSLKRTAIKLLGLQLNDPALQEKALSNYTEYINKCQEPLTDQLLVDLARVAVKQKNLELAKSLFKQIQQFESKPDNYPSLLLQLAEFYLLKNEVKRANQTAIDLIKKYPESNEAREVKVIFAAWRKAY